MAIARDPLERIRPAGTPGTQHRPASLRTVVLVAAGALAVRRRPRHAAMVLASLGAVLLTATLVTVAVVA